MSTTQAQVVFETDFFQSEPGEDENTNPGVFGKALATWLAEQLKARGISVEGIIPEDFGWVVMVSRQPFMLWLACGNVDGSVAEWMVYPVAEPSLMQRLFKRADTAPAVAALWQQAKDLVPQIPGVKNVVWD